jgi:Holliday junction resolvasome RuvABC endonuclease subunit
MVIEARVSAARKAALGNGSMAKEDVYKEIKKRFPGNKFKGFKSGGSDEADATVLAIAALSLAESS